MGSQVENSIVRIYKQNGEVCCAGFVIAKQRVITCKHVVESALDISPQVAAIPLNDIPLDFPLAKTREKLLAKVIYWDRMQDIAILEIIEPLAVALHRLFAEITDFMVTSPK